MNEIEKEQIFKELQAEIRAGLEAYERGECIPLEEVRERILNPEKWKIHKTKDANSVFFLLKKEIKNFFIFEKNRIYFPEVNTFIPTLYILYNTLRGAKSQYYQGFADK